MERIRKEGYTAGTGGRNDVYIFPEEDEIKLEKTYKHTIEIVIDRIVIRPGVQSRLAEAVELGLDEGDGLVIVSLKRPEERRNRRTEYSARSSPARITVRPSPRWSRERFLSTVLSEPARNATDSALFSRWIPALSLRIRL